MKESGGDFMILVLIAALLFSAPAFSGCENVKRIETGTASPCSGWIVSDNQMQKFAQTDDKLKLEEQISQVNKQLLSLSAAEVEFYKNRSKAQSKELEKAETKRFLSTAGAFVLGVLLTGVAAKAAIESAK